MTKKQIIIDGVDVSGCDFYDKNKKYCLTLKMDTRGFKNSSCFSGDFQKCIQDSKVCPNTFCDNNPNCYYKQLKAKEQECEELKEEIDDLKEIIQRHDNDNNALLSEFEDDLVDYYRRYKECLTEIKEIAEENIRIADLEGLNGVYRRGLAKQILQKISEVENEN